VKSKKPQLSGINNNIAQKQAKTSSKAIINASQQTNGQHIQHTQKQI